MNEIQTAKAPTNMPPTIWWSAVLAFVAAVAGIGLVLNAFDVVDSFDRFLGDIRSAILSPRAPTQRSDIAVVLINEETLLDYEVLSPISGRLIGAVLDGIAHAKPKAIGLDFIFDRRTRETPDLLTAMKWAGAGPLVLGAVDERVNNSKISLKNQEDFLTQAGRPTGHVLLEHKSGLLASGNDMIRYLAAPLPGPTARQSLASVLAKAGGYNSEPISRQIAWQLAPADTSQSLYLTLTVPRHRPEDVKFPDKVTAEPPPWWSPVVPSSWDEKLKGRIVLVGASLADRDQHATPFSVIDGRREPGVLIHAQALAQRIDSSTGNSRDIREVTGLPAFAIVALVALACLLAGRRYRDAMHEFILGIGGLVVVALASLGAFWMWRLDLPSGALAFAWAAGTFGGRYSDWFLGKLGLAPPIGDAAHAA